MRIIGGIHRSRKLLAPEGWEKTRPITDRVKQSLFDRLTSMGALEGGVVLDVFAGTGSLGLEALSRGMEHCVFIERDRSARTLLEKNIVSLGLQEQTTVMAVDALMTGWLRMLPRTPVDLLFLDPPYHMMSEDRSRPRLVALVEALADVAATKAILVLRTEQAAPAVEPARWRTPHTAAYGSMRLHFYEPAEAEPL